jgi:group I intron endonuclease
MEWYGFTVLPENIPLPRAGVYLITNQVNGKCYVGISLNIERRIRQHSKIGYKGRLPSAFKKHGLDKFLVTPLYYTINNDTVGLEEIEANTIEKLDSVNLGYNTIEANGGVGPYGPAYNDVMRVLWDKNKERYLRAMHEGRITPEGKLKHSRASKEVRNRPEIKEAHSKRISELKWITDGNRSRRIPLDEPLPEGWQIGRARAMYDSDDYKAKMQARNERYWSDPNYRAKRTASMKTHWSGEGVREARGKSISEARARPEVRAKHVEAFSNTIWINDSSTNRRIKDYEEIPDGWERGRAKRKPVFYNLG